MFTYTLRKTEFIFKTDFDENLIITEVANKTPF